MFKKKYIFVILIFFLFFLIDNILLDTGHNFAFDYIKNKVNNNFRENQKNIGKISNLNKDNKIFDNKKNIIGWLNNFNNKDKIKILDIKINLHKKFENKSFINTYLDKDKLIHYY